MQNFSFILLLVLLICTACSTEQATSTTDGAPESAAPDSTFTKPDTSSTTDFHAAFARFFEDLHNADTAGLNQFIHPKYGLWLIEQPGAMPKMTQVFQIQKFGREYKNRSFFTIAPEIEQCKLVEEAFPSFDCADMEGGKTGYSKDGCFIWNADKFKKSGYWDYANLSANQIKSIKDTLPLVQKSVLHTKTSFEFHFGYIEGQWHLLFARIIYPCSA
ncbi:hypothetical protein [Pontibacter sp. H249]|uniref:hypothetical protein n=1 Tax=Pontibacter sp. H249 TaxID=3133420 RepID=UPI0030BE7272